MIEKIELEKVFEAARHRGYSHCEVFAEQSRTSKITIFGKKCEMATFLESGIGLRLFKDTGIDLFTTHHISTESLLAFFNPNSNQTGFSSIPIKFENALLVEAERQMHLLKSVMRKTGSEIEREMSSSALYEDKIRFFETTDYSGEIKRGKEEEASLQIQYQICNQGKVRKVSERICRNSIGGLWKELEDDLFPSFKHPRGWNNPWPAPKGELMVHWSSQAVAKISLHFLRAFEGDLFLSNGSFLTKLVDSSSLSFSLADRLDTENLCFDHEGTPRKSTLLFGQGKPRGLACNTLVASQLEVPGTGHARRETFRNEPTIGIWNAVIQGNQTEENLLSKLSAGLSINDVEILRYDPLTGEIEIALLDAVLIHHSEVGEAVEKIIMRVNLATLLSSFKTFSDSKKTWGFYITKGIQRFLTQMTSPEALSPALYIPGSVPLSHYW